MSDSLGEIRLQRSSNLELMRVLLMLAIVAHHFVVNSGVTALWTPVTLTPSAAFLTIFGMWGKAAINAFVMVTGWYLCGGRASWGRCVPLLAQTYFWKFLGWAFLAAVGAVGVTPRAVLSSLVAPVRLIDGSFLASYLVMLLLAPFLDRLVGVLDRREHLRLLAVLVGVQCGSTTLLATPHAFSEVAWYCTLWLLAAYLRLRRPAWADDRKRMRAVFLASVALSVASVAILMAAGRALGWEASRAYYLVSDSGKLLAALTGVLCFLYFRLARVPQSRAVNAVASTTFGVLLAHAHSDAMRAWLWGRGGCRRAAPVRDARASAARRGFNGCSLTRVCRVLGAGLAAVAAGGGAGV